MSNLSDEGKAWWREKRIRYNYGLIVAGILAFTCYLTVLSVFQRDDWLGGAEVSVFTTFFQALAYLVMMILANLLYNLGSLAEALWKPSCPDEFRKTVFNLGFWFSVALPFLVPCLLLLMIFAGPEG